MSNTKLIEQAIESAKCRIYKLNFDTNKELSAHHQKKAEKQKKLMEITVEALEKQIPMKLLKNTEGFYCSKCKRYVESVYDYCGHCGQKADWSGLYE